MNISFFEQIPTSQRAATEVNETSNFSLKINLAYASPILIFTYFTLLFITGNMYFDTPIWT
jgi:hypothetical protein